MTGLIIVVGIILVAALVTYFLTKSGKIKDGSEGTDFHAVHSNKVSVTPLQIDLTAHREIEKVRQWLV